MDKRFLAAFIDPAPFRMLGRTLYPWCLKYRVRLSGFNSPLIDGHRDITPADLIFACQVCAEEPLGDIGMLDRLRLGRLNDNPARFEILLRAFSEYVLVADWPKFWEQSKRHGSNSGNGIPWPLAVVTNLIEHGIEEKRAWEMPECQAIWYNSAFAVSNGSKISIMSPEEEAYIESELKREAESAKAVANPAG